MAEISHRSREYQNGYVMSALETAISDSRENSEKLCKAEAALAAAKAEVEALEKEEKRLLNRIGAWEKAKKTIVYYCDWAREWRFVGTSDKARG